MLQDRAGIFDEWPNDRAEARYIAKAQALDVAHPEDSLLRHRLAHRADALSLLVEYLVWAASFRSAGNRVLTRRQEAAAHSAGAGANQRPHVAQRYSSKTVLSRPGPPSCRPG